MEPVLQDAQVVPSATDSEEEQADEPLRLDGQEPALLAWVAITGRTPTEDGTYVVMDRMLGGPRLLQLQTTWDKHWQRVTHWYGPLPVCPS